MAFEPVWASDQDAEIDVPSSAEQQIGFACGPVSPGVFNWLFQRIMSEINALALVDAVPQSRTISTTDGITGGGSLAANRTFRLNIPGLEAEASIANGDLVAIYDVSAGQHRKMTRANFLAGLISEGLLAGADNVGTGPGEFFSGLNSGILEFRNLLNAGGLSIAVVDEDVTIALADMGAALTVE